MTTTRSIYKRARISPRKVRLLADLIRGQKVSDVLHILMFQQSRAATHLTKTLKSALANVENNLGENPDDFIVKAISVDTAPTLKRIKPRAKGRADHIAKRSCHITMELSN